MSKETREYAKQLVSQMTLEEKMSQMVYQSPAIERLGIPAYNWWNEALHGVARAGVATVFPQAIGLAATFDKELLQEIGDVVSTEGRAKFNEFSRKGDRGIYKGLTFWAPNVNIFRDPRWGRGHETYGEDPYLTGELGCAYIRGLQGPDPDHPKAAACATCTIKRALSPRLRIARPIRNATVRVDIAELPVMPTADIHRMMADVGGCRPPGFTPYSTRPSYCFLPSRAVL